MANVELRNILRSEGRLANPIGDKDDLFAAGLDSIGMVNVMMAIEEKFGVRFPDQLLNRRSFASIAALTRIVGDLQAEGGH